MKVAYRFSSDSEYLTLEVGQHIEGHSYKFEIWKWSHKAINGKYVFEITPVRGSPSRLRALQAATAKIKASREVSFSKISLSEWASESMDNSSKSYRSFTIPRTTALCRMELAPGASTAKCLNAYYVGQENLPFVPNDRELEALTGNLNTKKEANLGKTIYTSFFSRTDPQFAYKTVLDVEVFRGVNLLALPYKNRIEILRHEIHVPRNLVQLSDEPRTDKRLAEVAHENEGFVIGLDWLKSGNVTFKVARPSATLYCRILAKSETNMFLGLREEDGDEVIRGKLPIKAPSIPLEGDLELDSLIHVEAFIPLEASKLEAEYLHLVQFRGLAEDKDNSLEASLFPTNYHNESF